MSVCDGLSHTYSTVDPCACSTLCGPTVHILNAMHLKSYGINAGCSIDI